VAGNGVQNFTGDGIPATSASLNNPGGVALAAGNLYIADSNNNRLRKVSTTGTITTVAGDGNFDFFGDGGLAALARLNGPQALAVDTSGNLYIADGNNDRIRKVIGEVPPESGRVSASSASGAAGSTVQIPITLSLSPGVSIDSLSFGVRLIPNGTAPGLGGALTFTKDASIANNPNLVDTAGSTDQISVAWLSNLSPTLSGTTCTLAAPCRLGTVGVTIPAGATNGQTYTIQVTGASGTLGTTDVALVPGPNATLTVGLRDYLVGDVSPLASAAGNLNGDADTDDAGEFGNDSLTTTDLIIALRAVTNLPGWRPPTCSDRFDAMDSSPADTEVTRGGNATLSTTDLIITLRRVTGIDSSRPRRASRNLTCP